MVPAQQHHHHHNQRNAHPDDSNDITHCPIMIQERYNRLHMIQHQTREPVIVIPKKKGQKGLKPNHGAPVLPSRVTRTSFDKPANHRMFGMIDQMLDDHDDDDSGSYDTDSCYDDSSSSDDDFSCASAVSYNSLAFGDDGINHQKAAAIIATAKKSASSNCDPTTNINKKGKSSSSTEATEDDDDTLSSDYDDDSSWSTDDDDDEEASGGAAKDNDIVSITSYNSDITAVAAEDDLMTIASGGYRPVHQQHQQEEDDPLTQHLIIRVPSNTSLSIAAEAGAIEEAPTTKECKKKKKSVTWSEKAKCRLIRHINDYSDEEVKMLFLNSKEAAKIRKESHQLIRLLENEDGMLKEIEGQMGSSCNSKMSNVIKASFHKNLLDCARGLERHTADNNEKLHCKRNQMYAAVFKIQSLDLPAGLMDMEGTIAAVCTKLSESSTESALELGSRDEQEAFHVYYGDGTVQPANPYPSTRQMKNKTIKSILLTNNNNNNRGEEKKEESGHHHPPSRSSSHKHRHHSSSSSSSRSTHHHASFPCHI